MNTLLMELALRWLHILSAIALAGGAIYARFVVMPATESLADATRREIGAAMRSRWSKLVMILSGVLLVTGLINFMWVLQRYDLDKEVFPASKYHMFFGIKFLLALVLFALAALLSGRTAVAESLRRKERFWRNVQVILAIVVVCLGGLLKSAPRHPKSTHSLQSLPQVIPATQEFAATVTGRSIPE